MNYLLGVLLPVEVLDWQVIGREETLLLDTFFI